MRILIIFCHPSDESFLASLLNVTCQQLKSNGHDIFVCDLYKEDFDPRLSKIEWKKYFGETCGHSTVQYEEQLGRAQGILFIYPTWFHGPPAILKGYVERVWRPGVAFNKDKNGGITFGNLDHVKWVGAITSCGSNRQSNRFLFFDFGKVFFRKVICKHFDKRRCRFLWLAVYEMDESKDQRRARFLDRVKYAIDQI